MSDVELMSMEPRIFRGQIGRWGLGDIVVMHDGVYNIAAVRRNGKHENYDLSKSEKTVEQVLEGLA